MSINVVYQQCTRHKLSYYQTSYMTHTKMVQVVSNVEDFQDYIYNYNIAVLSGLNKQLQLHSDFKEI